MMRVGKTAPPAATQRFTLVSALLLAVTVLGTTSGMILWLDSVPIKPKFFSKAMEAAWKAQKPTEFQIRIRGFPRTASGSPSSRGHSGSPHLVRLEAAGQTIPAQQTAVYVWATPNTGDTTLEGRTLKRPSGPVTVWIEMVETHRLPWWKRLLPSKWTTEFVEVRYPLSNQAVLADAPSRKVKNSP